MMNFGTLIRSGRSLALSGALALAASAMFVPAAQAITGYSTAGVTISGLGAQYSTPQGYDVLDMAAVSGSFAGPGNILLNTNTFTVGNNSNSNHVDTGSFQQSVTIDSITQNITIPYSISIAAEDTLTLLGGNTYIFGDWVLTLLEWISPTIYQVGEEGPLQYFGQISAIPLPASLPLFAAGLAGLGLLSRLRGRKKNGFPNAA